MELARLQEQYEAEKAARLEAEQALEANIQELMDHDAELANLKNEFEAKTRDLEIARDEALQAAKAKSQFMANMSHEIRTPLNGVIGMLRMLSETNMPESQSELVDTAVRSGQMLLEIVNDILDFSKIDAGQMELHEETINFRSLFADSLAPMRIVANERNLALNSCLPDDFPEFILADGLRLRQILTNLLSNALKFTSEGEVRAEVVVDAEHFEMRVKDSGIGMSPEQVNRIFSAFGQADGSITRQFGGTGLGLTITQTFIHMMGGSINVTSQPGEGSTFIVRLPLRVVKTPQHKVVGKNVSEDVRFRNARVLLVEDNEVNQAVALHLLDRANINVDVCDNGEEALTHVQLKDYGAVLMDIQMPVMDGLEAARTIRGFGGKFEHIPIVAMTAHATEDHRRDSIAAGMNAHLNKPIEPLSLYRVLSEYFEVDDNAEDDVFDIVADEPISELGMGLPSFAPGLRIAEALGRLSGNEKLYLRLISTFYNDTKTILDEVQQAVESQSWDSLLIVLHTAKGSAANIGANVFSDAASKFEQALKEGLLHDLDELIQKLEESWVTLEDSILVLIQTHVLSKQSKASTLNDESVVSLLREVQEWLHKDMSKVDELMEQLASSGYEGSLKEAVATLAGQLEVFDIASAEETLATILA